MATALTPEQEHERLYLYQCIVALAGHCDGALAKDFQGFNGVDTHFGRRVAGVPREQWTQEVYDECAHIILKYREQVLTYTGTDVATLQIVKDAQDAGTNYAARDQARRYEKRAKHLASRVIDVAPGGKLGIRWANGDPEFRVFLPLVQALPGRRWNPSAKVNEVLPSPQVEVFVNEYDFTITPAAQALLSQPAPAVPIEYQITLEDSGRRVFIKTNLTAPGQAAAEAVKQLPGRSFDRTRYGNTADASPAVVAFAATYGLNITPEAKAKCEAAQAALKATNAKDLDASDWATVAAHVSSLGSPEELPAVFVQRIEELLRNV